MHDSFAVTTVAKIVWIALPENKYQAVKLSPGGSFAPWRRIREAPYTHGAVYTRRHICAAPYT